MNPNDHLKALETRYACKAMNGERVADDVIERILEAARLAPTSSGLQPFSVLVVTNDELKAQLRPVCWDQPQITDCSHLLVFAAWGHVHRRPHQLDVRLDERSPRLPQ